MVNILVCDDDKEIAGALEIYLRNEGYNVFKAYDGMEALNIVKQNQIHLILMDVMMPNLDGIQATMKIREENNIPIIMLSAKSEDYDKIIGLNVGADDYITKPFLPKELLLRIGAVLRRSYHFEEMGQSARLGQTLVSMDAGTVTRNGKETALTAKELALFQILFRNRGKIVTTDALCDALWPDGSFGLESSLIVHMRHLREKVEAEPSKPKYLITVRGLGYKLEKES